MTTDSTTTANNLLERARSLLAANPVIGPQVEQFWKAQDSILKESEAFSKAWFDRRHKAARSAINAMRKISGDGADPSAAMRAIMDWQQGSFQRLADDTQEWVALCARCTGRMADAEAEAGKRSVQEVAKRAKSATVTKHATPV